MSHAPVAITREELTALKPCDLDARLALFGRRKSLTVAQALKAGATVKDILWVAGRTGHQDKCVEFALQCAERVAHLDKSGTAQKCIDATRAYIADPTPENEQILIEKRRAADAAYVAHAAADAAHAAHAADAAHAAYAAYAAAACAAYAAYAAADAGYAGYAAAHAGYAGYAAHAAERTAQQKILIKLFS